MSTGKDRNDQRINDGEASALAQVSAGASEAASSRSEKPLGVVTVTYSPGEHLRKLIDSLPGATSAGCFVVLADNGSVDGTPEAEEQRALDEGRYNVEFVPTGGNIGYGAAANRGIAQLGAKRAAGEINGDYVLLVNPDVIFSPGSIDAMLECAQRNPRAGAIGPLIREADGSVYPSARAVPELVSGTGHALLADVWPTNPFSARYRDESDMTHERDAGWLSGSCLLLKWEAFDVIRGFDSRYFMYMEDVDLGDRLGKAGWRNVFCPSAEIRHAQGHSASSHPEITVKAHHDSAYRFMSDRLPGAWRAPIRWGLKLGLSLRGSIILALRQRKNDRK